MKKILLFIFFISPFFLRSQTVGWFYTNAGAADGYILFAPLNSDTTYLIDKCGKRIHEWPSNYHPGDAVYLLEDGVLLHTANMNNNAFSAGGSGGRIEKIDWDGNLLWSYQISDNTQCQHHDAIQLPNGNILTISWEDHSEADAVNNGRDPSTMGGHIWSEKLIEIKPDGINAGTIVWQWRAWDHLIQHYDSSKLNYGVIADHPELIDINLGNPLTFSSDWLHINGIDYNAALDQIVASCHNSNEVWIIDHSTTLDEATSHAGGTSGHGGDLLYRWGNPRNYGRGTTNDQKFYGQHNAHWIPEGFPGGGDIMVFNNGVGRPGGSYSTVETFAPPAMADNNYPIDSGAAFAPAEQDWIYTATPASSLYSSVISGAQRLQNGNTIFCEGSSGNFEEIDFDGNGLWKYVNPVGINGITSQGNQPNMNSVFRCVYLPADYAGLSGHILVPGAPIEYNPLNYVCYSNLTGVVTIGEKENELVVYPVPFQKNFALHVPVNLNDARLVIRDMTGRIIYEDDQFNSSQAFDEIINFNSPKGIVAISIYDPAGNNTYNTLAICR